MRAIGLVIAGAAFWIGTGAAAQDPAPGTVAAPMQRYGDSDKTCVAWTDGCRSCRRDSDQTVSCSNIGIACQPGAIACTSRQPPAPEPPK
jgi:hypothetical protein